MAINIARDTRKTEFWKLNTPGNVGPGIYYKDNGSQFDHKRDA